jgi:hypothetical protein
LCRTRSLTSSASTPSAERETATDGSVSQLLAPLRRH